MHYKKRLPALGIRALYRALFEQVQNIQGLGRWCAHFVSSSFLLSVSFFHGLSLLRRWGSGDQSSYKDSTAHFYLTCREGLPFYNNYPLVFSTGQDDDADVERFTRLISGIHQACLASDEVARAFRVWRSPRAFCDTLVCPESYPYFAILHAGAIFKVPINACLDVDQLRTLLIDIISRPNPCHQHDGMLTLSECASYRRHGWSAIATRLYADPVAGEGLRVLRQCSFLLCIDQAESNGGVSGRFANLNNRFADKALQVCMRLGSNEVLVLCEHASFTGAQAASIVSAVMQYQNAPARPSVDLIQEEVACYDNAVAETWLGYVGTASIKAYLQGQLERLEHRMLSVRDLNLDAVKRRGISLDMLVQLAIYEAYRTTTGLPPTLFEPVALDHLPGRALDFINPVSMAFKRYQLASSSQQKFDVLVQATHEHKRAISQSKQGYGLLSHLLQISYLRWAGGTINAIVQRVVKYTVLAGLPAFRFIYDRTIMASNGGSEEKLLRFGTLCHVPGMLGVGYLIKEDSVRLDILLNKPLHPSVSLERFSECLAYQLKSSTAVVQS
ncbi:choline/carnitine O-acyltransferase [Pseudomonas batumici]|uniref:BatS n=2 Tax=Pseudomonas TaxID=286 RepID=D4NZF4_PSEFL|nr:choline/carnitine O-acyltransferase [Pseudomonas batumici]ADD82960.1 BatS [Pseudomonas fluorescens]KIH86024.1 BatS, batumin synthesis operon, putative choline/carnitine o-acyltransferase [Pseudomonas batumici]